MTLLHLGTDGAAAQGSAMCNALLGGGYFHHHHDSTPAVSNAETMPPTLPFLLFCRWMRVSHQTDSLPHC